MKQILTEIFKEHQFNVQAVTDYEQRTVLLAKSEMSGRVTYFIVIFIESMIPENFLSDYVPEYVELIKPYWKEREVAKNTSLLVCVEKPIGMLNSLEPTVHEVEEDPFDFKKLVLVYTRDQVECLRRGINSHETVTESLQRRLKDHEAFAVFKASLEEEIEYSLITKLFIKLPFLKVSGNLQELDDLSKAINHKLSEDLIRLRDSIIEHTTEELDIFATSMIGGVSNEQV